MFTKLITFVFIVIIVTFFTVVSFTSAPHLYSGDTENYESGDISALCQQENQAPSHLLSLTEAAVFTTLRSNVCHTNTQTCKTVEYKQICCQFSHKDTFEWYKKDLRYWFLICKCKYGYFYTQKQPGKR